jgi:hypothetical protein
MTLGLLGVFGCVSAFDNSFCGGLTTVQGTSASLRVKGLRVVGKYYAERGAQIDHPATLAGMDRFWALQGDVFSDMRGWPGRCRPARGPPVRALPSLGRTLGRVPLGMTTERGKAGT